MSDRARAVVLASSFLLIGASACASDEVVLAADSATPDATTPPARSVCNLTEQVQLDGAPHMNSPSLPRFAHGYVYFVGTYLGFARAPLDGGEAEQLGGGTLFTVRDDRVFYASWDGQLGEINADGSARVIATGQPMTQAIAASSGSLYYCEGTDGRGPLHRLAMDGASAPVLIETHPNRRACPQITAHAMYWTEPDPSGGSEFQIVRADLDGANVTTVVPVSPLRPWAVDDGDRTIALLSDDRVELRALDGSETHRIMSNRLPLYFDGNTALFSERLSCVAMPNVGNGMSACSDKINLLSSGGERLGSFDLGGLVWGLTADDHCMYWIEVRGQCHGSCDTRLFAAPLSVFEPRDF